MQIWTENKLTIRYNVETQFRVTGQADKRMVTYSSEGGSLKILSHKFCYTPAGGFNVTVTRNCKESIGKLNYHNLCIHLK